MRGITPKIVAPPDFRSAIRPERQDLLKSYLAVRAQSEALCKPLKTEDCGIQSMPDVSPPKWHLAHTTWFFERFLLMAFEKGYQPLDPQFHYLFNSYYKSLGPHYPRMERGMIARPTLSEVHDYRRHVDERMFLLMENAGEEARKQMCFSLELGLHHEQQHQELLVTDIKHILYCQPLKPAYRAGFEGPSKSASPLRWVSFDEGLRSVGHSGEGFSFDNERPQHRVFLESYRLASRPVTNGEYLDFIQDKAYQTPTLWLSDGWDTVLSQKWEAPLYWEMQDGQWMNFTLKGVKPLHLEGPVCHLSYYEADAYARWAKKRLPSEAEWESAALAQSLEGNFLETNRLHPAPAESGDSSAKLDQIFGDVWEWTQSAYLPYPRFKPFSGNFGEYNGKFMCSQMVLRGGSCATPRSHFRTSYRNFFQPHCRWQFSGLRLAEDS